MRRVLNILGVMVTIALLSSCHNNVHINQEKSSITLGLATRTYLGELDENNKRKIFWSEDDCIVLNGNHSSPAEIDGNNQGVATFSFASSISYPYSILYPAQFYKDGSTITLPKKQLYAKGSFAANTAPMATYTLDESKAPVLHHLMGVIKLSLRQTENESFAKHLQHPIQYVRFEGNNGEQIWGDFTIDYTTTTLTPIGATSDTKKVYAMVEEDLTEGEVLEVFIVVPARTYEKGFTIRVMDSDNHFMKLVKRSSIKLDKGEIYSMPEVSFEPTFTSLDIGIN